jgi:hypothetical protein
VISPLGEDVLAALVNEWQRIVDTMDGLLN